MIDAGHPLSDPTLETGSFVVQDEASQLVALLAGEHPGPRVLDTCASPGGKTTAIAATLGAGDRIVACDVRDKRIQLLRRTVEATAAPQVLVVQADLEAGLPFGPDFACVFVDAPCSGLGTLRRDPDIRWRRAEADLPVLAAAQRRMLREAARAVSPRGRLVYATCSSEPEENQEVVERFLAEAPSFRLVPAAGVHPDLPPAIVSERGYLRTTPDEHGLEGFFGAVLERFA